MAKRRIDVLEEKALRLAEIREEIADLVREAREVVAGTGEEHVAKAYWASHLDDALSGRYSSMAASVRALDRAFDDAMDAEEEAIDD